MNTSFDLNVISVKELAAALKRPSSTIYEWIRKNSIPVECIKRIGKSIFIKTPEITEFIKS